MNKVLQRKPTGTDLELWACSRCAWTSTGYDIRDLFEAFNQHNCANFPRGKVLPFIPKAPNCLQFRSDLQRRISKKGVP